MNLHLLPNEKITSSIIQNFEETLPGQNHYIIWKEKNCGVDFIKEANHTFIIDESNKYPDLDYSIYDKVIIHSLDNNNAKLCIDKIKPHVPLFWILWGAELYNYLIGYRGYPLYHSLKPPRNLKNRLASLIKRMGFISQNVKELLSLFLMRDVTMVCAPEEYDLLRRYYPKQTKKLKNNPNFFYYPIEKILGSLGNATCKESNILIGNSNSWTNNHLMIFKKLKGLPIEDRMIFVPLNYGGNEESKAKVIKEGEKIFKDKFFPIIDFLPLQEYNKIMLKAGFAVYGSWRQEAMGNILVALYLGMKVFLSNRNPLFSFFQKMGITLYSVEEINQDSFKELLPADIQYQNSLIIKNNYNFEKMQDNIRDLFG